jgi:hypothetical protein
MAKTYRSYLPEQDLLLPPSLRDWLPENHLVYFVSDLIDQVDLSGIEGYYEQEECGYPPYHPPDDDQDSGLGLLRGSVLVAATAPAVAGRRGLSGVGGGQRARLPHHLGLSYGPSGSTGRAVSASAADGAGTGCDEAGAGGD